LFADFVIAGTAWGKRAVATLLPAARTPAHTAMVRAATASFDLAAIHGDDRFAPRVINGSSISVYQLLREGCAARQK
jgi:hypothetical protein